MVHLFISEAGFQIKRTMPLVDPGCGEFSPPLHRLFRELLEWHAGEEPISHARSRRTVQVAQHDHRLAPLRSPITDY